MPYMTSAERIGREIGREIGRDEGIEAALAVRFGAAEPGLVPEIRQLTDLSLIRKCPGGRPPGADARRRAARLSLILDFAGQFGGRRLVCRVSENYLSKRPERSVGRLP